MHSKEAAGYFVFGIAFAEKASVLTSKSTSFFQSDQFLSVTHSPAEKLDFSFFP